MTIVEKLELTSIEGCKHEILRLEMNEQELLEKGFYLTEHKTEKSHFKDYKKRYNRAMLDEITLEYVSWNKKSKKRTETIRELHIWQRSK